MRLLVAATVALVLLLSQAAGEELTEERAGQEQGDAESTETAETTTDQAVTEPPIKLVHVLNPGEREYLSPNLIGVQNIAMTFLPLSMNFINVIDAFREITAGVRYEILLNAIDTKAKQPAEADTICRLVILEKPWLRTQWGDKHRELVNSNCSDSAENSVTGDPAEKARLLNEKYVSNSIFNGGQRNELSDAEMANLESQILTNLGPMKRKVSLTKSAPAAPAAEASPAESAAPAAMFASITVTKLSPPEATNETAPAISIDEAEKRAEEVKVVRQPEEEGLTSTTVATELNDNEKRWLDDFLSVGAYNFEKSQEQRQEETVQEQKDPEVEATTIPT
uniref:Cysteine proteinase CG12163 n=1 Tax=Drosophila rhopaloa TaxID=1041015 RepID=A0A6P4EAS6_DRORH